MPAAPLDGNVFCENELVEMIAAIITKKKL
jgi:hypothetical protein